jgi:1-deoxy-D-xylulose-5-phosphate reductoisomerase
MGPKVTIDSATLFNKGLEILEAHFLFDIPLAAIEVVIHPESLVHGLVRFADGSVKAQVGPHDMRLPIQVAIEYPDRPTVPLPPFRPEGSWHFLPPDRDRFPSLDLAYQAGKEGGLAPAFINAADEVAVTAFLAGKIAFPVITEIIAMVLASTPSSRLSWDSLDEANAEAQTLAVSIAKRLAQ